jgi:hypothetical protein
VRKERLGPLACRDHRVPSALLVLSVLSAKLARWVRPAKRVQSAQRAPLDCAVQLARMGLRAPREWQVPKDLRVWSERSGSGVKLGSKAQRATSGLRVNRVRKETLVRPALTERQERQERLVLVSEVQLAQQEPLEPLEPLA